MQQAEVDIMSKTDGDLSCEQKHDEVYTNTGRSKSEHQLHVDDKQDVDRIVRQRQVARA